MTVYQHSCVGKPAGLPQVSLPCENRTRDLVYAILSLSLRNVTGNALRCLISICSVEQVVTELVLSIECVGSSTDSFYFPAVGQVHWCLLAMISLTENQAFDTCLPDRQGQSNQRRVRQLPWVQTFEGYNPANLLPQGWHLVLARAHPVLDLSSPCLFHMGFRDRGVSMGREC